MGWFSPDMQTMDDLFIHSLQDIYYAEHQILKALPDMAAKASDAELKKGFNMHLRQTKGQIKRLDQAFKKLKAKAQGTTVGYVHAFGSQSATPRPTTSKT